MGFVGKGTISPSQILNNFSAQVREEATDYFGYKWKLINKKAPPTDTTFTRKILQNIDTAISPMLSPYHKLSGEYIK